MTNSTDPVHPSAVGTATAPDTTSRQERVQQDSRLDTQQQQDQHQNSASAVSQNATDAPPAPDEEYPEQKHAGKVGYGPNYHQGPTFTDKVTGIKEQVKGKVTRNQTLEQKGHDRVTGELKQKQMEQDMNDNPFEDPEEKQAKKKQNEESKDSPLDHEHERAKHVQGQEGGVNHSHGMLNRIKEELHGHKNHEQNENAKATR